MKTEELIERLEGLTGPDRYVDSMITVAVGLARYRDGKGRACYNNGKRDRVPHYTASLDAVMALAVKYFDTGSVDIEAAHRSVGGKAHGRAEICGPHVHSTATGATPAIALLIALLRALKEE